MSELARAVAFVFRRKGAETLPEREFVNTLSFDLRWLAPSDARRLLSLAIERELVRGAEGAVQPAFALDAVDIPVGWRAGPEVLEEAPQPVPVARAPEPFAAPPVPPLLARAAEIAGADAAALRTEAERERERAAGLLTFEAALVLAVARRGRDARELAKLARAGAAGGS